MYANEFETKEKKLTEIKTTAKRTCAFKCKHISRRDDAGNRLYFSDL